MNKQVSSVSVVCEKPDCQKCWEVAYSEQVPCRYGLPKSEHTIMS